MRSIALLLAVVAPLAGADPMRDAREAMYAAHGDHTAYKVMLERFELLSNSEGHLEGDGWWGGDIHKLWIKADLEHDAGTEELEIQALYSRAVSAFWDLQVGVRSDVEPDSEQHAVIGFNGHAPYWFEIDGAVFVDSDGDMSARIEAEYELRLTQRWVLQPRLELNWDDDAMPDRTELEGGLRLRYEVRPQLAPYLGVSWSEEGGTHAVAGIRAWF